MNTNNETDIAGSDVEAVKKLGEARERILTELRKTIVGIEEVIEEYDDEFVPEELDEDAEADLSMPADSDFDKSFQGKSGSGDSVF